MVKIMLVEDDKSLREIYGARLLAEGYDIVSAGDGEEALAIAIKEKPGLIISDVMMPKISGFDMLDILRSSSETRNVKVIMMTALSSDDQRQRGEQLGADRYLVKSQVGIEDVVRVVHEVLEDTGEAASSAEPAPIQQPAPSNESANKPEAPASETANPQPPAEPTTPAEKEAPESNSAANASQTENTDTPPSGQETAEEAPAEVKPEDGNSSNQSSNTPSGRNNIIQPINDPTKNNIDINALLDKEMAREAGADADNLPAAENTSGTENAATTEQERGAMEEQITQFAGSQNPQSTADSETSEQPSSLAAEPNQQPDTVAPEPETPLNEASQDSSPQSQTPDSNNSDQTPPSAPPPPPRPPVAL